ncbi:MAG TPA: class I SAM-dependent methyltransferase [Pirellulales bacterium]|nr:class I SAM-dependent methyltransferase [Pirellulales bacterium]
MAERHDDGSAGDVDYGKVGHGYSRYRQPEPRIAAFIDHYLGDAVTVLNVGAGAGSYEPSARQVTAVEPSASMRAQRPRHLPLAIDAVAERLPFADEYFDAAMASFTVHQWTDMNAGLREMRRVTRGPVVVMTCDPDESPNFWLGQYAPEVVAAENRRNPPIETIRAALGGETEVVSVPIPLDCSDGFHEAYYGRPECLLDPGARRACSAWSFVPPHAIERFVARLSRDLSDGTWDAAYGHLRTQPEFLGPLKLVISRRLE